MIKILCFLLVTFAYSLQAAESYELLSPDKTYKVTVDQDGGEWFYSVEYKKQTVVAKSKLGVATKPVLFSALELKGSSRDTVNKPWHPILADRSEVKNHYNLLTLNLRDAVSSSDFQIHFRAYEEGVGFQYTFYKPDNVKVALAEEQTEFSLAKQARYLLLNHPWGKYYQMQRSASQVKKASLPIIASTENYHVMIT